MKIFVWDRYSVLTFALIAVLAAAAIPLTYESAKEASGAQKELPIYSVERGTSDIAVTFNCAWSADDIESIIETLKVRNCTSTFFVVGEWAQKYPDAVKKLHDAGHEIANHSMNHSYYTKMKKEDIINDIGACDAVIGSVTGSPSALVRAPYGDYNNTAVLACRESGHMLVQWDVDSLDWKGFTARQMEKRINDRVRNGSIILFHNGTAHTAEAIGGILDALSAKGFTFKTVSDLIYQENYTIDRSGRQISN